MRARYARSVVLLVNACGSNDPGGTGAAGSPGVLNVGGTATECLLVAQSGAGEMASDAENLALATAHYNRCSERCRQAQAAHCTELDYDACVNYCVGWQNRTANGICASEIGAYIDCWRTIADPCAFPSGPVPQACVSTLVDARCCLGLSPYEDAGRPL